MSKFIGWNFFSQFAFVMNIQGTNMLLNIFFGVTVNAARGIANQVNTAVVQFINNFMTAVIPQITKSYASGDKEYSFSLVCRSSRFAYFLMFFLSLPILIETETILNIWLKNPPEYAVYFVRWTLAASLTTIFGNPMFNLIMADGRIKLFQSTMTIVSFLPFPLSWLCFRLGYPVISAYIVYFIVYFILIFLRFFLVHRVTQLPFQDYILGVVARCIIVSITASVVPLLLTFSIDQSFSRLIITGLISVISVICSVYVFGLTTGERIFLHNKFVTFFIKKPK
jgi:O-antigen/teichoic acid export membrane protein